MLTTEERSAILQFDTCKIANAIETLGVRMRNEGFTRPGLRCVTGGRLSAIGYAATSRVRADDPPVRGATVPDLAEWWEVIRASPKPGIAVIEDVDEHPGQGAVVSEVHASILRALDCHAVITNGSVRNIPALADAGFAAFACHVSVSHEYIHLIQHDCPVEILGLRIKPGDLLYADVHGVISLPEEHLSDILRIARELAVKERRVIDFCQSPSFSVQQLRTEIQRIHPKTP